MGFILALLLSACATSQKVDKDAQITSGWPVERLYTEASDELTSKNYARAIKLYDILMARYPYGRFAEQALLDKAYANYRDEEKEKALESIEEFERLYPKHPRMDYALYLKGMVQLDLRNTSWFDRLSQQDWSDRDPESNRLAYEAYAQLVKRFPDSQYAADALQKMKELVEALGGHEMAVARYYYKMGAYVAAANRAKNILNDYKNTSYVEEALALMMSAYDHLQQKDLAFDAKRLLQANFPQSVYLAKGWYDKNAKKQSWSTFKNLVKGMTRWHQSGQSGQGEMKSGKEKSQ